LLIFVFLLILFVCLLYAADFTKLPSGLLLKLVCNGVVLLVLLVLPWYVTDFAKLPCGRFLIFVFIGFLLILFFS